MLLLLLLLFQQESQLEETVELVLKVKWAVVFPVVSDASFYALSSDLPYVIAFQIAASPLHPSLKLLHNLYECLDAVLS